MRKKKKFLISGANGFVGRSLLDFFQNNLDFKRNELFALYNKKKLSKISKDIKKIKIDLLNTSKVNKLLKRIRPDVIFHLAAYKNPAKNEINVIQAFEKNFIITKNIIENLNSNKVTFIFLSTDKVYSGKILKPSEDESLYPNTFYGILKLQIEKLIEKNLLNHIILRVPIIHSNGSFSNDSFIDNCIKSIEKKNKTFVAKNIKRQFIQVSQLSEFLYKIRNSKKKGVFNIASTLLSYYDRVKYICKINNINSKEILISKRFKHILPVQDLNIKKFNKNFFFRFN